MRRVRNLTAIARQFGMGPATRLAQTFAANTVQRIQASVRSPLRVASAAPRNNTSDFIRIDPFNVFQPDSTKIEAYAHFDISDSVNIERRTSQRLHHNDVPYSNYMGEWHFHPGRIGGELVRMPLRDAKLPRVARRVAECFVELPDGGLALYYPKTFGVTRLRSKEFIYSGIAQAQLLAGYARLARSPLLADGEETRWRDFAARIAQSLQFPLERGGVNMEGKVLLETPNFRGPPEIILNGWMDALIHLHDFLEEFNKSASLRDLFEANVSALAQLLPQFDDENLRLSRYSNLTPWRARLRLRNSTPKPPTISVRYRATTGEFRDYLIEDLCQLGLGGDNFFENKVLRRKGGCTDILISSSSLYDVEVQVRAENVRLELNSHPYGIWSTNSDRPGCSVHIAADSNSPGGESLFRFSPSQLLMTGQRTDFAKGYNFYHTYHVVALFELSRMTHNTEAAQTMVTFARRWHDYIRNPHAHITRQGLVFADLEKVFRQVTNNRGRRSSTTFAQLVQQSARI